MKKIFIYIVLTAMLLTTTLSISLKADTKPAVKYGELYNGCELVEGSTYYYKQGKKISYFYSDGYFRDSSKTYNEHLSTLSMTITAATIESSDDIQAVDLLKDMGFNNTSILTTTSGSRMVVGNKTLYSTQADECVLIPISIVHVDSIEYYKNYYQMGASGDASGASKQATEMQQALATYLTNNSLTEKNIKFWIMGYGFSAGAGDILSAKLSDTYTKDKVFAYLFEPLAAGNSGKNNTYENIHCVCNYNDGMNRLMPEYMGFGYYGVPTYYGDNTKEGFTTQEQLMLAQLELVNGESNEYISPNNFTWAQIYVDISADTISSLINGEFDIWAFVDTNHKYGTSPKAFWDFAINKFKSTALTSRADYTTNIPSDVKTAYKDFLESGSEITLETAVGLILDVVNTLTDDQLTALAESFPNFNYKNLDNIAQILRAYNYATKMELPLFGSYSKIVTKTWNMLDTTSGDYKALSSIFTADQTAKIKKALPIAFYRASQFASNDWSNEKQVIGSIGYNIDYIGQAINPSYNLAWIRSYDSYYTNEKMCPIDSVSSNIVEIRISAPNTALTGLTVDVCANDGTKITSIVNSSLTAENISKLFGKVFVHTNDEYLSISYLKDAGYYLSLSSTDELEKVLITSRLYNTLNLNENKQLYLYTGQVGYVKPQSDGTVIVNKDIVVTETNCTHAVSKDKSQITISSDEDYCTFNWKIDNAIDNTKTETSFTIDVTYDSPNVTVEFVANKHNYGKWINESPATCTQDGTLGHYHCSECGKDYDAEYKQLTDLVITKLNHDYDFTKFEWTGYTAKAVYTCKNDKNHVDKRTATVTNEVTTKATCTVKGVKTYTASYDGHTDTKTEDLGFNTNNHDYEFTKFEWDGYTAKAVYVCKNDKNHVDKRTATVTNEVTTKATCIVKGVKTYTASYDGHTDTKTEDLGFNTNKHNLNHVDRKEASRKADGNIEYWYCEDCDKYYSDANTTNEITQENTIIAKESVVISSISMYSSPIKIAYIIDEDIDVTGGQIEINLSNGTKEYEDITNEMISGFDSSSVVESQEITVTYESFKTKFNVKIRPQYILGDVNDDGVITDADAIQLLMYTFFPDDYPINQPCDFNGDKVVTDADAIQLLMYTFFPDDYPLSE